MCAHLPPSSLVYAEGKRWVGADRGPCGEGRSRAGAGVSGTPTRLGGGTIRTQVAHPEC